MTHQGTNMRTDAITLRTNDHKVIKELFHPFEKAITKRDTSKLVAQA